MNTETNNANNRQVGGNHYAGAFQHWDLVPRLNLSWQEGCGTKYLDRIFKKHAVDPNKVCEDMEKVVHYVDKQIELVIEGIIHPFPNTTEYREYHESLYHNWIDQRNFGTSNGNLQAAVRRVLSAYASWSWHSDGSIAGLNLVKKEMYLLLELYQALVIREETPKSPVQEDPSAEEMQAYQNQSVDSVADTAVVKESLVVVDYSEDEAEDPLVSALIQESRLSLQMLIQNQPLSTPVNVYRDTLDSLVFFKDEHPLDLGPRITAGKEDNEVLSSFRDYAEGLLKIELGISHLDEGLPSKQTSRVAVALWAVLDGATNLQHWLLRTTEGDNPVLKDPAEAHYFRLQLRKCTAILHQNALAYLQKHEIDPGVYTAGSSNFRPVSGAANLDPL